jgi:AraC-like DNA-binding protein
VSHIASRTLSSSQEPVVATFALFFLVTGGQGHGRHLEQVDARPGELHFIPAGVEIHALNVGELGGWLVAFDPTLLGSLELEPLGRVQEAGGPSAVGLASSLAARGFFRLPLGEARRQRLEHLIAELDAELRERQWGFERAAHALFLLLLTELRREARVHASGRFPLPGRLVQDVLAFVATHSLKPISLADVAAAVDRTPSHVATAVREETGLTVGDWLREHRMAEARRRLLETKASVESIASQVGYADVTSFVRGFRRAHGMTPRVWRERHRQERG